MTSTITPAAATQDGEARYQLAKDSRGQTYRLDTATGTVAPVDTTKARVAASRTAAPAPAPRIRSRPAQAADPSAFPAFRPTPRPTRVARPQPALVDSRAVPARIEFGGMCGEEPDALAVTLVDAAVYAKPSIGTPLVARVVSGTLVTLASRSGEWRRVNLDGAKGPLSGFVHCSALRSLASAPAQ